MDGVGCKAFWRCRQHPSASGRSSILKLPWANHRRRYTPAGRFCGLPAGWGRVPPRAQPCHFIDLETGWRGNHITAAPSCVPSCSLFHLAKVNSSSSSLGTASFITAISLNHPHHTILAVRASGTTIPHPCGWSSLECSRRLALVCKAPRIPSSLEC